DAHAAVVTGDRVGADEPAQPAEAALRARGPTRLVREDQANMRSQGGADGPEFGVIKMMRHEVADDSGVRRPAVEGPEVPAVPARLRRPVRRTGCEVDCVPGDSVGRHAMEFAFARADFQHAIAGPKARREFAAEPAGAA